MIPGNEQGGFFVRSYDKIVLGVGALALVGGVAYYAMSLGADVDAAKREVLSSVERRGNGGTGVEKPDMTAYQAVTRQIRTPQLVAEVSDMQGNFLASEKRVKCKCGKVIVGGLETCPDCKESLIVVNKVDEEAKKIEGWKTRFGVEPDDSDADSDGFTNAEEYAAGTDPKDGKDHPDYIDSLKLVLPLKETYVPFVLCAANQIPSGWRCEFFDPKVKDNYGRMGRKFTATIGEEIGAVDKKPSGYVLKSFEKKEELRAVAGAKGMKKSVDTSVAVVERKSDSKTVELVMQLGKKGVKLSPVDVQATLVYERGGTKTFDVVPNATIELNGSKYRILGIKAVGKGAEVTLENMISGKKQILKALE